MNRSALGTVTIGELGSRKEVASVYTAAVIQGVAQVSFPAARAPLNVLIKWATASSAFGAGPL
jgi:hypothetical protein